MSSSHRNGTSKTTRASDSQTYPCPECGKDEMRRLKADCELLDGIVVPDLDRWHCFACGEDFLDSAAMDRVAEIRKSLRPVRRAIARKVSGHKHA